MQGRSPNLQQVEKTTRYYEVSSNKSGYYLRGVAGDADDFITPKKQSVNW